MYSTNLEDQAGSVPTYLTLALGTSISACRIHPVYGRQAAVSELPELLGLGWQATARHKSVIAGDICTDTELKTAPNRGMSWLVCRSLLNSLGSELPVVDNMMMILDAIPSHATAMGRCNVTKCNCLTTT